MTKKKIIQGLQDLIVDRESFITEKNSIFAQDKQVLEEAIKLIQEQSMHNFQVENLDTKIEKCDFIPPERIREACTLRGYTYEKASDKCDIDYKEFCLYINGHKDIPDELAINFMKGFNLPKTWFYRLKWGRLD